MRFLKIVFVLMLFTTATSLNSQTYKVKTFAEVDSFLSNVNDSLYVINFWATWCKSCVEELPAFEKLDAKHPEVKVILISMDGENYWTTSLQQYLNKNKINAEVWVIKQNRPTDWIDMVDKRWQGSIPATMFLNNAKQIQVFQEHPFTYDELVEMVNALKI